MFGGAVATKALLSAKKSAAGVHKGAAAAAAFSAGRGPKPPTIPVKDRAVDKEDIPLIIPNKESTKTTMMPWRGWVDRLMKDKLSEKNYKRIRGFFYYLPDDPYNLQQIPMPSTKVPIGNDGEKAAYREVSPGSQDAVRVPLIGENADPYDSGYFKRDTRRRYVDPEFPSPEIEELKLSLMDPDDPDVQEAKKKLQAGPKSSPGNKGRFATGPSDFDPTGLRAVMSATHVEMQKTLDANMPDHLPTPVWVKDSDKIIQWYEDNDLPVPVGGNFNFVPKNRRVARW